MFKKNSFSITVLRNFGTEQIEFKSEIPDSSRLAESINQIQEAIYNTFVATVERAERERAYALPNIEKKLEGQVQATKKK